MNKRKRQAAFFIVVIVPAAGWFVLQSQETKVERAYRLCGECGMDRAWVDRTIENITASGASREAMLRTWERTFADSGDPAWEEPLCQPCVDAVLDVASGAR